MLLFVQLVQISRAMTTYENMRGTHHSHGSRASEAITTALAAGTFSVNGMPQNGRINGPDPAIPSAHVEHHHHKTGCFAQWKKILGVDTFVETALHGYDGNAARRRNRNPFSRGCIQNCKDFWYDPAPICGARENGVAMLDGEVVNYTTLYEAPLGTSSRTRRTSDQAGSYEFVSSDDSVV
jgi:palmitoyltransferase ZDHHC13/17